MDSWRQNHDQFEGKCEATRLPGKVALELGAADTELVGPKIGLEGFNDSGRAQATTGPRIPEVEEVAPASTLVESTELCRQELIQSVCAHRGASGEPA